MGSRLNNRSSGRIKPLPGAIDLTTEPCCVTGENGLESKRAEMPCGCAISAEGMEHMFRAKIKEGKRSFNCPNCTEEWEYSHVRHVLSATMLSEELRDASATVTLNVLKDPSEDARDCLNCGTYMRRDFTKAWDGNYIRVICNICTKRLGYEYKVCWLCGQQWKRSDASSCGNANCENAAEERAKVLQTCTTTDCCGAKDCPEIRACPNCLKLIRYGGQCKQMHCKCGCSFCFVCLETPNSNGKWPCGEAWSACQPAPRQTTLSLSGSSSDPTPPNISRPQNHQVQQAADCTIL